MKDFVVDRGRNLDTREAEEGGEEE